MFGKLLDVLYMCGKLQICAVYVQKTVGYAVENCWLCCICVETVGRAVYVQKTADCVVYVWKTVGFAEAVVQSVVCFYIQINYSLDTQSLGAV